MCTTGWLLCTEPVCVLVGSEIVPDYLHISGMNLKALSVDLYHMLSCNTFSSEDMRTTTSSRADSVKAGRI